MKLPALLQHRAVVVFRSALGELGAGLALAWFLLMLLEFVRPMLVTPYLNLNQLLALGTLLWLMGARPAYTTRLGYGAAAVSAILVGVAAFVLAVSSPYRAALAALGAFTTLGLWLVAQAPGTTKQT